MRIQKVFIITLLVCGCTGREAVKLAKGPQSTSAEFQRGESLFFSNEKKDSAFYYFTNVSNSSKDSLLISMAYAYMAMIQDDAGDYFGAQESALEGLRHINEKSVHHHYCLSSLYNELGVSSAGLRNYNAAIEYYDLAIKFQQDEGYKTVFENNKAVSLREKGDYREAIQILESLMGKQRNESLAYARILTNLASLRWMADPGFYPVPDLVYALNIRKKEKNKMGIASSFNHLSDYYLSKRSDSAFFYAKNMFVLAAIVNSSDQKLDALRKLVLAAPAVESKRYFAQYQQLNDSIITARNQAKNQFALIRYHSEKSKADNLLLQKENSQKEVKILRQRISIYGISILSAMVILFFLTWLRKKRRQLRWETEAAIRENQLQTSQKVHDIVANGLYRIMNEIEYNVEIGKEALLDKIEQLYERSRDISYEPSAVYHRPKERVEEIVTSFATAQTTVSLVGNQDDILSALTPQGFSELEHVLQELMINMAKHSEAHHVVIRFDLADGSLIISYRDDGKGFQPGFRYGNGLRSTENRIHRMGGELILAVDSSAGASIKIVIPIRTP